MADDQFWLEMTSLQATKYAKYILSRNKKMDFLY